MIHPQEKVPTWKRETAWERLMVCASMLAIHGFLSDGERLRVHKRMLKWQLRFVGKGHRPSGRRPKPIPRRKKMAP